MSVAWNPPYFAENFDVDISLNQRIIQFNWNTFLDSHPFNRSNSMLQIVSPTEPNVREAYTTEKVMQTEYTDGSSFQVYLRYLERNAMRRARLFHGQVWSPALSKSMSILYELMVQKQDKSKACQPCRYEWYQFIHRLRGFSEIHHLLLGGQCTAASKLDARFDDWRSGAQLISYVLSTSWREANFCKCTSAV